MRSLIALTLMLATASAWGQSKSLPTPQAPVTQTYQLVPVQQPVTQQYQTVQVAQQPQYQTVQVVQQPQYQAVYQAASTGLCAPATTAVSTSFATTASAPRTVVLGPSVVGLSIARAGQLLTSTFGKTHVWNISHQVIRPVQPAPPVSSTVFSVGTTVPVQQQVQLVSMPAPIQQTVQYVQQPVTQTQTYTINAPSENAPPPPVVPVGPPVTPVAPPANPPTPTPQAQPVISPVSKFIGGLFHH